MSSTCQDQAVRISVSLLGNRKEKETSTRDRILVTDKGKAVIVSATKGEAMKPNPDLFDEEPKPNSPEDIGGATFVPRADRVKPWHKEHPDHPANRPHNKLEPGEEPPTSWNVANVEMGIFEMRVFLGWCADQGMDCGNHSVGTLYVALNAHSKQSFKWLCQSLKHAGMAKLPSTGAMNAAMSKRSQALLYDAGDP